MNDDDTDALSDTEREALHLLGLGLEHVERGHGHLVAFHHQIGHAMGLMADAEAKLRETGHEEFADCLRDELLPAGVVGDSWTYELVEAFEEGFYEDVTDFEASVRDEVADGTRHVQERSYQEGLRERAEDWETEE